MSFTERTRLNLSQVNKEVLKLWDEYDLFHRSMSERSGCPSFIFFEGPPSANGHPGIHHVLARSLKDTFCRFKTMKGFLVKRKAGWDTHGLPVELGVEKELGITKEDIGRSISIEDYNARCRKNVMEFTSEWRDLSHKMGYWVDLDNPYITYDNKYIETLWWLLKQLYNKQLLYKGYTIQPYSPAAGTGLSSHELNQPGCYRDVKDTTCTAQFVMKNPRPEMTGWGTPCFLAWTTTPWTLSSNTALCVGPNITYACVRTFNIYNGTPLTVVMAKARLSAYLNPQAENLPLEDYKPGDKLVPWTVVAEYKGSDLVGMRYEQLQQWVRPDGDAFRVISGDYVTTDDGTGIVHIAPTFGADDAFVAKAAGIPPLHLINKKGETRPMVDLKGKFYLLDELDEEFVRTHVNISEYERWQGQYVKNAYDPEKDADSETLDVALCLDLKQRGLVFKIEKHVHNYPHCWRTDKPILYYPLDSWFIRSSACKQRMMELNETILWKPASTGTGRFGKWLENLNDWNLSRSRYWGTPLPIWRSEEGDEICIGSVQELYDEIEKSVRAGVMKSNPLKEKGFVPGDMSQENYDRIDLHRPFVDDILLVSANGHVMRRELDLIDVWFDSGAMPYAQIHYPFENKEELDNRLCYPANFIAEGVDQTRGWFFTLHALGTMIFDSVAFRAVISNGLVLDKNGQKMSKRLGNAVDPFAAIEKYGTDALRWYMITNSQPWDNLSFDPDGVAEVAGSFFAKLSQTYGLLAMYANVDGWENGEPQIEYSRRDVLDRWIISALNTLVEGVTDAFENYEPTRAGRMIQSFVVDDLSNWYVRLVKKRLWGNGITEDKLACYQTLHECLLTVAKLMAPIAPFYADRLYADLTFGKVADSVHLDMYPEKNEGAVDELLNRRMALAQKICSMALSLRKKEAIGVRQALQQIAIPVTSLTMKEDVMAMQDIIMDEVNLKEINFVEGGLVQKQAKPNFRVMGKRFGKQMKAAAAVVAELTGQQIAQLEQGTLAINVEGQEYELTLEDVEITAQNMPGWSVTSDGALTVALDITITPELRAEGMAREMVRAIQTLRKSSGLEITDRINVRVASSPVTNDAVCTHADYIKTQVLAKSIEIVEGLTSEAEIELDEVKLPFVIEKA